ncbi:hypothetical protein [Microtetraspora malaysiensis]|uniref:Integrase n=1 Tax=Microtetraspora malaysiensis TaxID=161358 RepID=A0ABW6SX65_9ACTN
MRTRLRKLRIGGREFLWRAQIRHVRGEGDCHRCIRVRMWGAGKTGRALQADLLSKSWPAPWGACATDGAYPAPQDVRALVVYAVEHGWEPDARGGTHILTESEHASTLELSGFLLTDRLCLPEAPDPTARVIRAFEQRTGDRDVPSGVFAYRGEGALTRER